MKYIFVLFVFCSFNVLADDSSVDVGFFDYLGQLLQDISDFFFVDIPAFFVGLYVNFVQYWIYLTIKSEIFFVRVSHQIAVAVLDKFSVTKLLESALNQIPANIGYYLVLLDVPDLIQFIIEAFTTRFVMSWRS